MNTLAIIGGGAAGLAAAVAAGEELARMGASARNRVRVVVYEADERVGRSILATGNGRCNFSNAQVDAAAYRNAAFAGAVLNALGARTGAAERSVLAFFERHGLAWRAEDEGRLYPLANKASVVLDVLRAAAAASGVEERTNAQVKIVEAPRAAGKRFTLRMADGAFERADAVVVACGGSVSRELLPEKLAYIAPEPVLGPLATDVRWVRQLDNIRVKAALKLRRDGTCVHVERGEVLFRKYGVSGIAAFNLSRFACPGDELAVDFTAHLGIDDARAYLAERARMLGQWGGEKPLTCADVLRGLVLPQVAHVLCARAQLAGDAPFDDGACAALADLLQNFTLSVEGIGDARQCQVHRGGFDVEGFSPRTLEALDVCGLYVAGEALDVDAPCGGYNLHWAWASGLVAGANAALACAEAGMRTAGGCA